MTSWTNSPFARSHPSIAFGQSSHKLARNSPAHFFSWPQNKESVRCAFVRPRPFVCSFFGPDRPTYRMKTSSFWSDLPSFPPSFPVRSFLWRRRIFSPRPIFTLQKELLQEDCGMGEKREARSKKWEKIEPGISGELGLRKLFRLAHIANSLKRAAIGLRFPFLRSLSLSLCK